MENSSLKKVLLWGGFLLALALLLSWRFLFPAPTPITITNPETLPGIQTGVAPWPAEIAHLAERLRAIGLPALGSEGVASHIHQHLDIFVNGVSVAISAGIGINPSANFISDVHVHDGTGVIHVESPVVQPRTLGEFFDVWGVRFTKDCIGGYCATASSTLAVYDNGALVAGNPRALVLASHHEIAIVFGAASSTLAIPSSHIFSPGE